MSTEIKYDVFISYSRKDYDEVVRFVKVLKQRIPSLSIWFDIKSVKVAEDYEEKIVTAIDSCRYIMFFISDNSLQSKHTKREISYAEVVGKKVIPVLIKRTEFSKGWFLYKFGTINYTDVDNKIQVKQLIENLKDWINHDSFEEIKGNIKVSFWLKIINCIKKYNKRVIIITLVLSLSLVLCVSKVSIDQNKLFYVNGIFFDMIYVEGGTFSIRDNSEDKSKQEYNITLRDYYIGEAEVTQGLWRAVMGENPSFFRGERKPVECISYNDCMAFVKELNNLTKDSRPKGFEFRLPTEMEWEFAARGGVRRKDFKYSGSNDIATVAWYNEELINKDFGDNVISVKTSIKDTHNVCQKTCNELLLYDMSGNVWEWCYDWYADYSPNMNWQTDPQGPLYGKFRVLRGGSCSSNKENCNVTSRFYANPDTKDFTYGIRLVLGRQLKYNSNK